MSTWVERHIIDENYKEEGDKLDSWGTHAAIALGVESSSSTRMEKDMFTKKDCMSATNFGGMSCFSNL